MTTFTGDNNDTAKLLIQMYTSKQITFSQFIEEITKIHDYESLYINDNNDTVLLACLCIFTEEQVLKLLEHFNGNIHIYNNKGRTPLMRAISRGFSRVVQKLLERLKDYPIPREKYCGFQQYKMQDFKLFDYKSPSGSYGKVFSALHLPSNKLLTLKEFKEFDSDVLSLDLIREISFITKINQVYPEVSPILFGYIYENDKFYLVYETMLMTFDDYIEHLSFSDKIDKFSDISQQLLTLVSKVHSLGIVHGDIKQNNIMLSGEGKLVLIDFGISDYYAFYPSYYTALVFSGGLPSVDEFGTEQLDAFDSDRLENIKLTIARPSYYSDLFILGIVLLQYVTGGTKYGGITIGDEIYFTNLMWKKLKTPMEVLNLVDSDEIKYDFGIEAFELLKRLLQPYGPKRYSQEYNESDSKIYNKKCSKSLNDKITYIEYQYFALNSTIYDNDIIELPEYTTPFLIKECISSIGSFSCDVVANAIFSSRKTDHAIFKMLVKYYDCCLDYPFAAYNVSLPELLPYMPHYSFYPFLLHIRKVIFKLEVEQTRLCEIENTAIKHLFTYLTYASKTTINIKSLCETCVDIAMGVKNTDNKVMEVVNRGENIWDGYVYTKR